MIVKNKWELHVLNGDFNPKNTVGPSITVPDMDLDLKRAVQRMAIGQSVAAYVPQWLPVFEENFNDFPDFDSLSRIDKLQWAADNRQAIIELRRAFNAAERNPSDEGRRPDNPGNPGGNVAAVESKPRRKKASVPPDHVTDED